MSSTIQDTKNLIKNFPHIDQVYIDYIPNNVINQTNVTQCLLREVDITTAEEGNNTFNAVTTELELQIFFKKHIDFDTENFEIKLLKLLTDNQYTVSSLGGKVYDPDNEQLTMTWYVDLTKIIKE